MPMKKFSKSIWTVLLFLNACGVNRSPQADDSSKLASLSVGEYVPSQGQPVWSDLNISFDPLAPTTGKLEKTFPKSAFAQGKAEDVAMKVPYGSYNLRLAYKGSDGKTLYRSCP